MSPLRAILAWGRMVKFHHSVFALPFAVSGAALAGAVHGISVRQVVWIVVAMVGARNAAMGFNRLADHALDARNPRTSSRELPKGVLGRGAVWTFTLALAALFVFAAFNLNRLCGWLSFVALAVTFGYSFTKRFTWTSHLVLGLSLAMAPVGGWLAVAGSFAAPPWLMGAAVLAWVAGFDVVYACQDETFDRSAGLHSIPSRFGVRRALHVAQGLHALAFVFLVAVGVAAGLHPFYWAGLAAVAALLVWQHSLLDPDDLSRVGMAFFNANGLLSVVYLAVILACVALGKGEQLPYSPENGDRNMGTATVFRVGKMGTATVFRTSMSNIRSGPTRNTVAVPIFRNTVAVPIFPTRNTVAVPIFRIR